MTMEHGLTVTSKPGEVQKQEQGLQQPEFTKAISISPEYVKQSQQSLALLQQLVNDVLVADRDYGTIPGVDKDFLWDSGANIITSAFNAHFGPSRIMHLVDTDEKISAIIEVPIISYLTGKEVGCGTGSASTNEVKHKYRWIYENEFEDWGYTKESGKALKHKKRGNTTVYRIPNPERGDLLNTIVKISAKRGRVAASQTLPGVASALRDKFAKPEADKGVRKEGNTAWDRFYARCKSNLDLNNDQIHEMLKVKSMKDWVSTGLDLEQAYDELEKMVKEKAGTAASGVVEPEPAKPPKAKAEMKYDPTKITNLTQFYNACMNEWPNRFKAKLHILNFLDKTEPDISDPGEAYRDVWNKMNPK